MMLLAQLFTPFYKKESGSIWYDPFFYKGAFFAGLFLIAVGYAYVLYPDWMWMYFVPNVHHSVVELCAIFIFLYVCPYVLGFYLGVESWKNSKPLWVLFFIFNVLSEAWLVSHLFDRYSVLGTTTDYLNHTGVSLFSNQPLSPVMNGSVGAMVFYYLWILWKARKSVKF